MWLAVEFIPRLRSGKLDRKQTTNPSLEDMTFASKTELELHKIWSHVLNLIAEQLGLRQSFLSVGGDSISAMQVMSECRKRGLGLAVSHIISCKSVSALTLHVKDIETPLFHQEILEQPFELSPIQKLYFSRPNHSQGHYNQSFLLHTSQRILQSDMRRAIETIIRRHSMLRARFSQDAGELVPDTDRPLPFQTWCKTQLGRVEALTPEQVLPVHGLPNKNAEYWGMEDTPNVYGQMAREGFEIGSAQTSLLLSKCHQPLRTEIPDVLLAAMIFPFGQTFTDRPIPAVFAEGHGRESWGTSIDLSDTVGWFTTIYPVFAGSTAQSSLVDTVKLVKDRRRKVPGSGRPYFASRWLTQPGKDAFSRHWPLEITFNYLGQYQQLERDGALCTPAKDNIGQVRGATDGADVGPLTTCISFFEVSAVILKGSLRFSFVFNQNMNHQPEIRQWIASCQHSLGVLIESLAPEPTLSDFILLSLTYDHLQLMTEKKLPEAVVTSMDLVEDAYPYSPMQSRLLISSTKNSAFYAAYTLHEVKIPTHAQDHLHGERTRQDSLYDQGVLKEVDFPLIVSEKHTKKDTITAPSRPPLHQNDNAQLLHRFEICTSKSGKVFCRLDISHIIMDGTSLSIVFRDLALAYEGSLGSGEDLLYRKRVSVLAGENFPSGKSSELIGLLIA
ncbi:hypothetical protein BGZ61DRAFT_542462 [Ilyonectria robusta]|uniref:uncharacterized protein n=1 Tax=Ilyonectria robusta TaxID=1079257 RepID=UPI001E8DDAE1|nr:uncharacterized protein BGZ61DRAFT_542462 [Ilyonectria robusta]KAH8648119.1 hypothetical protein BGZ61DRAFT_542462 [Ilyonectria robusta]